MGTQKKIKALFFVTSLKEKKASFKNLCHSIPKRFNLNTTVPLLRILPSLYTVHRMGQRNWSSLEYSNIYVPNGTFHFFLLYVLYFFQLKLSMFQLPSVTKLFFSSGFGEINKKQPSSLKKKKKKHPFSLKKKKKKKKKK